MTPLTPLTPLTPIIPIHYKASITSPSYNIRSSPLHEMEILQPNDNWSHRHFKIISDKFSILTTNTLNSTISSSPFPTLHDGDSYLDDSDFEN
ncbi:unnamed protein product [Rhizophagus irregularis]|uniref:Uncharacterized protein n=1 Tax=Rhizophagus irregularis TaxID=588596 RepID=A0A915Z107_9GLOM|nr:unnamed protein product [Rhizophagus irregularis]CAB5357413.1 unnamed protein product [Rhizophagus irregularis]